MFLEGGGVYFFFHFPFLLGLYKYNIFCFYLAWNYLKSFRKHFSLGGGGGVCIFFFHFPFYQAYISIYTKFYASTLPGTTLKVFGGGGWVVFEGNFSVKLWSNRTRTYSLDSDLDQAEQYLKSASGCLEPNLR